MDKSGANPWSIKYSAIGHDPIYLSLSDPANKGFEPAEYEAEETLVHPKTCLAWAGFAPAFGITLDTQSLGKS